MRKIKLECQIGYAVTNGVPNIEVFWAFGKRTKAKQNAQTKTCAKCGELYYINFDNPDVLEIIDRTDCPTCGSPLRKSLLQYPHLFRAPDGEVGKFNPLKIPENSEVILKEFYELVPEIDLPPNPFMEHLTSDFENVVAAMEYAVQELRSLPRWEHWITFSVQFAGPNSYEIGKVVRMLGDRIEVGAKLGGGFEIGTKPLDVPHIIQHARTGASSLVAAGTGYSVAAASPQEVAQLLDAIFRHHFGILYTDEKNDYAVTAEWGAWFKGASPQSGGTSTASALPNRPPPERMQNNTRKEILQPTSQVEWSSVISTASVLPIQPSAPRIPGKTRKGSLQPIPPVFRLLLDRDYSAVQKWISSGGDIHSRDANEATPLIVAARDGDLELLEMLLNAGADVNAHDKRGKTALHLAVINGHDQVVERLLDAKSDVNSQDRNGNTPLFDAVLKSRGYGSIIKLLRRRGADDNLANHHGRSPLELAKGIGNYDVLQFFDYPKH